jgi:hypothetical protein
VVADLETEVALTGSMDAAGTGVALETAVLETVASGSIAAGAVATVSVGTANDRY